MAEIIPFKGLRYNLEKIGDLRKVIAPPYDVISKAMQDELYQSSEYNIIRLIHNRAAGEARYHEAADYLGKWQQEGVLTQDDQPAIYVYEQDFEYHGELLTRRGFIAALRLKPLGAGLIYPHERTLSKPREDRLQLIKATDANLSPIFALYIDGANIKRVLDEVSRTEPEIKAVDSAGVAQKLWLLTDESKIAVIQKAMKGQELFIADGHHRYETSLLYKEEMTKNGSAPTDYTMMMFVDMNDRGVVIKPSHRIVKLKSLSFGQFIEKLKPDFSFEFCSSFEELKHKLKQNRGKVVFGLSDGKSFHLLSYLGEPEFDLIILQREIKRILGLDNLGMEECLSFADDAQKALARAGDERAVFFVNSTPIETVKKMARAHQIMPQKSTYFYPKLTDGLVIRLLN